MAKKPPNTILVTADEKQSIPEFPIVGFEAPQVGVFDEPLRYYPANKEWAQLITGALGLYAQLSAWSDATDENDPRIQAALALREGLDLLFTSCDDIEACIIASQTILDLQAAVAANQANIQSNANAISALDGRVTQNESDIADNQAAITTNANNISQHTLDIADNTLSIQQHLLTLNNHETRITALEQSSGGGSGGTARTIQIKEPIATEILSVVSSDIPFDIPPDYDHIIIETWSSHDGGVADSKLFALQFNNDTDTGNYFWDTLSTNPVQNYWIARHYGSGGSTLSWNRILIPDYNMAKYKVAESFQSAVQGNGTGVRETYTMTWKNTNPVTKMTLSAITGTKFEVGTIVHVFGVKTIDVLTVPETIQFALVTFDTGTHPYSLPAGNVGVVTPNGGNPDAYLGATLNDLIEFNGVEIDLGQVYTIDSVGLDAFRGDSTDFRLEIRVDGNVEYDATVILSSTFQWETVNPVLIGVSGQLVQVRMYRIGLNGFNHSMDNIIVNVS